MKLIPILLLLSLCGFGQQAKEFSLVMRGSAKDTTITKPKSTAHIFKDVYGNWYPTPGIVETDIVYPDTSKKVNEWVIVSADSSYQIEYRRVPVPKPVQIDTSIFQPYYEYSSGSGLEIRKASTSWKQVKPKRNKTLSYTTRTVARGQGFDIYLHIVPIWETNDLGKYRAFVDFGYNDKTPLKAKKEGDFVYVLINNKWMKL